MDDESPDRQRRSGRPTDPVALLRRRAANCPEATAFRARRRGVWHATSWLEYLTIVERTAHGLRRIGFPSGGHLAILSDSDPAWACLDLAVQSLGGTCLGLYVTTPPHEVERIVREAGIDLLVVQYYQDVAGLDVGDRLIVTIETRKPWHERAVADWQELQGVETDDDTTKVPPGPDEPVDAVRMATSGTEGPGKVVGFRPEAAVAGVEAWIAGLPPEHRPTASDRVVLEYPFASTAGRLLGIYLPLVTGTQVYFPEDARSILAASREVAPTLVLAPARLLTLRSSRLEDAFRAATTPKARLIRTLWEGAGPEILRRLVISPLRRQLGLRRARAVMTFADAVPERVRTVWESIGLPVLAFYGLAECAVPGVTGTCAQPEVMIDDSGEILLRGPLVASRYIVGDQPCRAYGDGWMRTGDAGALEDGQLTVWGRVQEAEMQVGNVDVATLQRSIREDPAVLDTIVRPDSTNLHVWLEIDVTTVVRWAREHEVAWTSVDGLMALPALEERLRASVRAAVQRHGVDATTRIHVLRHDLHPFDGHITPTRRLRRTIATDEVLSGRQGLAHPGSRNGRS